MTKAKQWPTNARDCADQMELLAGDAETMVRNLAAAVAKTGDPALVKAALDAQVPMSTIRLALNSILSKDIDRARKILGI